jgi:MtN3 and saliva related transmembrane protein
MLSAFMPQYAWTAIGAIAALLTSLGFLPQVLKMWKRRSVGDVSLGTLVQFTAGVTLWTLYGFYIRDEVVVIANLATLVTLIAGLLTYYRFRRSPAADGVAGSDAA